MSINLYRPFAIFLLLLAGFTLLGSTAYADLVINIGSHDLIANTAGQEIQITVTSETGDPLVKGVSLNVQIGDGGADFGGTTVGPKIQNVDLITGTIFAASNEGQDSTLTSDYLHIWELNTSSGQPEVAANGLLFTLTVDTSGFFSGTFDLQLRDTLNGSTEFPIQGSTNIPTIFDGSFSVSAVPEPSSTCMFGLVVVAMGVRRKRTRTSV